MRWRLALVVIARRSDRCFGLLEPFQSTIERRAACAGGDRKGEASVTNPLPANLRLRRKVRSGLRTENQAPVDHVVIPSQISRAKPAAVSPAVGDDCAMTGVQSRPQRLAAPPRTVSNSGKDIRRSQGPGRAHRSGQDVIRLYSSLSGELLLASGRVAGAATSSPTPILGGVRGDVSLCLLRVAQGRVLLLRSGLAPLEAQLSLCRSPFCTIGQITEGRIRTKRSTHLC
jgi:hypothetical protein